MSNQKSFEDILARVTERLHPDMPQQLVQEVLRIQIALPENDSEARRQLLKVIDEFVNDKGEPRAGTEQA